jgi:hypothetical protein
MKQAWLNLAENAAKPDHLPPKQADPAHVVERHEIRTVANAQGLAVVAGTAKSVALSRASVESAQV